MEFQRILDELQPLKMHCSGFPNPRHSNPSFSCMKFWGASIDPDQAINIFRKKLFSGREACSLARNGIDGNAKIRAALNVLPTINTTLFENLISQQMKNSIFCSEPAACKGC